ncbi:MAG TPA: hypothetical protein VFU02_18925 [Polyangiaceae bacterium]|nr:hypothetical protein [Polyangiaceae bacterium]
MDPSLDAEGSLQGEPTSTSSGGSSTGTSAESAGDTNADTTSSTSSGSGGSQGEAGAGPDPGDSTASGGTSGTGGATNTSGGEPEPTLCESYCDDIMESCTGPQLQYRDHAQCMKICKMLPEGELGQVNENTVSCRAKYVGDARYGSGTELEAYCRRGGPGGGGYCGSNCEGFCSLMMHVCTGSEVGVYQFESSEACVQACEDLPTSDEGYSVSNPLIADGNHVECRLFHVTSAAMLDPEEHCEHAMGVTLCEAPSAE